MNFINELVFYLAGGHSLAFEISAFFFVILGVCINVLYTVTTSHAVSTNCPVKCRIATSDCQEKFCKLYFWRNNKWRLAVNLLMAIAVVRFFAELTGKTLTMGYCFLIGLVFDAMFVVYRKLRKRIIEVLGKSDN